MRDDAQELLDRLRSMRVRLDRAIAWLERECPPSLSLGCRGVVVIRLPPSLRRHCDASYAQTLATRLTLNSATAPGTCLINRAVGQKVIR